ncbi:MAG TPA: oligosaccharide flippase family protein, partial [Clostridia bacterium]
MRLLKDETYIGVLLSMTATGINLIMGLVLVPTLLHYFGQSEYGLYQLIGSFIGNLAILDMGFGVTTTRYVSRYTSANDQVAINRFLSTIVVIYAVLAVIAITIGIIVYNNVQNIFSVSFTIEEIIKARQMISMLIFSVVLSIFGQMFIGILAGFQKYIFQQTALIFKGLSTLVFGILVVTHGADCVQLTRLSVVIMVLYYTIVGVYTFKKCKFSIHFGLFDKTIMLQAIGFAFFVFCQMIMGQLYFKSGELILGIMTSTSITAIYSVGITIYNVFYSFTSAIGMVVLPKASQFSTTTTDGYKLTCFIVRPARIISSFYLLMVVGFICCGKQFIFMWSGKNFELSYYIVMILSIASIVPRALSPAIDIARAYNEHRVLTGILAGAGVVTVCLSIVFIKLFGVLGTAIATSIALVLCNSVGVSYFMKRKFGINLKQLYSGVFRGTWIAPILSLISGILLNIALPKYSAIGLVFKCFLIVCVFISSIFFFGLNEEEKHILYGLKQ